MALSKVCTRCGATKPPDAFHRDKSRGDGLFSWCRVCCSADKRARYLANPSKQIARSVAWAKANPDRRQSIWRANGERHRARYTAIKLAWAEANPEKVAATIERRRQRRRRAALERRRAAAVQSVALREARLQARRLGLPLPESSPMTEKSCRRCLCRLPLSEFTVHRSPTVADDRHPWCRACVSDYRRAATRDLRDSYVRLRLAEGLGVSATVFPQTLVEAQRAKIALHREIRKRMKP